MARAAAVVYGTWGSVLVRGHHGRTVLNDHDDRRKLLAVMKARPMPPFPPLRCIHWSVGSAAVEGVQLLQRILHSRLRQDDREPRGQVRSGFRSPTFEGTIDT